MAIADCSDPNDVLNEVPCLNCLSIHQLWIVLAGLFANANGEAGDLDAVKVAAAKYRNLGEKQFLIGLAASLPASFWDGISADNVAQDFGCMNCWGDAEIKAVLLEQWCSYWATVP